MSPSDLGQHLKPFVFLDLFEADMRGLSGSMPVHPHSGIATVTVFTDGDVTFDDPQAGHGTIRLRRRRVGAGRTRHVARQGTLGCLVTHDPGVPALARARLRTWSTPEPEAQYVGAERIPSRSVRAVSSSVRMQERDEPSATRRVRSTICWSR